MNGIPSSCRGGRCAFTFSDSATPTVQSIYPGEGQGGDEVTIYGIGFTDDMSSIVVRVGVSVCDVTAANTTQISCVLASHPAGFYKISLSIKGSGMAAVNNSVCFHFLLSVATVTPTSSGVGGGVPLTITGNGFLEFDRVSAEGLGEPLSVLPWFRNGIGLPSVESLAKLGMCSAAERRGQLLERYSIDSVARAVANFEDHFVSRNQTSQSLPFQLLTEVAECISAGDCKSGFEVFNEGRFIPRNLTVHLLILYYHFPAYVIIGETPCIIIESSVFQLTCLPVVSMAANVNVTVTVFSDSQTLSHDVSLSSSPQISSIEPLLGTVSGGTMLTISGTNFGASNQEDVSVRIGGRECVVSFANESYIACVSPPHPPGYQAVLISTPRGVAVLDQEMAGSVQSDGSGDGDMGVREEMSLFPIFRYRLVVYSDGAVLESGSVFGGTAVTLEGEVFVPGMTRVLVGGQEAELQGVTMDMIQFDTPTSSATHSIKLSRTAFRGEHE